MTRTHSSFPHPRPGGLSGFIRRIGSGLGTTPRLCQAGTLAGAVIAFSCCGASASIVDVAYEGGFDYSALPSIGVGGAFGLNVGMDLDLPDLNPSDPDDFQFMRYPPLPRIVCMWLPQVNDTPRAFYGEEYMGVITWFNNMVSFSWNVTDNSNDPDIPVGTEIVSTFHFLPGAFSEHSLTGIPWNTDFLNPALPSTLEMFSPSGELLASGQITTLVPAPGAAALLLLTGGVAARRRR